jgi:hypothetical protein
MRNVTISMDDDLYKTTRVEAAKAGKSMSRFIAETVADRIQGKAQTAEQRRERLARLQKVFDGPLLPISVNGRMPDSDERNARR